MLYATSMQHPWMGTQVPQDFERLDSWRVKWDAHQRQQARRRRGIEKGLDLRAARKVTVLERGLLGMQPDGSAERFGVAMCRAFGPR
jgi:hypothetical protein